MKETVVIGASRDQKLCSLVLEYTVRKYAGDEISIIHTYDKVFPEPKHAENKSRTGFSFHRFAIPELTGYQGVGLYLECDQIVFASPRELFEIPFDGATILRPKNQASVLLLDCERLRWNILDIIQGLNEKKYSYHELMVDVCVAPQGSVATRVPNEWNSLDSYEAGQTKLLHYTNMAAQPWRNWGHPLAHLWMGELKEAIKRKKIPMAVVEEEVEKKYVVPQVLQEVTRGLSR